MESVRQFVSSSYRDELNDELTPDSHRPSPAGRQFVATNSHPDRSTTPAETLTAETLAVCTQIDRRLGNPPGTAARGCWFWHWPPHPAQTVETLAALHADAVAFLHKLTNREDCRERRI